MTVFCDNDVLLRLAVYDLAEPVLRALGAAPDDVRVLATARFWIGVRDPERGRRRYGEDAFERACTLLEAFGPVVDESPDPVEESVLAGVAGGRAPVRVADDAGSLLPP